MEPIRVYTATDYVEVVVKKQDTPDYAYRIARGLPLPVNSYYMTFFNSNGPTKGLLLNTQYYDNFGKPSTRTSVVYPPALITGPNHTSCNNMIAALDNTVSDIQGRKANTLLSKIKAQSLPVLTLYKERHQTGKLITKFLDDAIYCVSNLRHPKRILFRMGVYDPQKHSGSFLRKLRKKTMSCETAGDAWLQYRFAWIPLYHDIISSLKSSEDFEKKIHQFSQSAGTKFGTGMTKNMVDWLQGEEYWSGSIEGAVSYKVNYYISDATLAGVGSMMDIPTFLWDEVPWSFVIDRVVNISSYLDLHNATLGTEFTSGSYTTFYRRTITPAAIQTSYYPNRLTYLAGGRQYTAQNLNPPPREDVYMKRIKLSSFTTPTLEYSLSFILAHCVDYVALGRQVVKKFRQKPKF